MGSFSIWHWLVVLAVVLLLFGAGKLPRLASDLAQGIKSFRKGMQDDDGKDGDKPKPPEGAVQDKSPPKNDTAARG